MSTEQKELELIEEEDIQTAVNEIAEIVKTSPEIIKISQEINLQEKNTIMSFGQQTAEEISRFSDSILASITTSSVEDSGKMLQQLNAVMKRFDIKELEESKPGFFEKLFNRTQDALEKLFKKYESMGDDISKVYVEIKKYENEIEKMNNILSEMFEKNLNYYADLEKYIQAGYTALAKFESELIPELEKKANETGEQIDALNVQNIKQSLEMLNHRIHDLELAKMVSLQTIPQIKLIQKGNYNLLRKINSAFVITIPLFKSGMVQAITIKRQQIQTQAMEALDKSTNELLLRNAENIASQSVATARLAGSPSLQIETLEKTFETIMNGIEETKQIEDENKALREQSRVKLQDLQGRMEKSNLKLS